ncbi:putative ribonuclease H protein, partial [Trifolium medium]|nr:putative ribonuclease H protein [Trifolium medium]
VLRICCVAFMLKPSFQLPQRSSIMWKAPSLPYVKFNMDASHNSAFNAACGGLFWDSRASFLGAFACNLGQQSMLFSELSATILTIAFAHEKG